MSVSETLRMKYSRRAGQTVLSLVILLTLAHQAVAQQVHVSLDPAQQSAARGSTTTVAVRVDVSGAASGGGAVFLQFPEARLRFVDGHNNTTVWNGSLLNVEPRTAEPGIVTLSVGANAPGVSGAGVLVATLHFLALSEGEAALTLLQSAGTRETLFAGMDLVPLPTSVTGGQVLVTAATTPVPTPVCAGDCSHDSEVTVDELIIGVRIALEEVPVGVCSSFDIDGSGQVTVDELIVAIGRALSGCPVGGG